jgi:hypothetical protein
LKTVNEDGLEISTQGIVKPWTVDKYVQAWLKQIWEYEFMGWFKGKDSYTETKAFEDHQTMDLAMKLVIYRFDCNGQTSCCSFLI